MNPQKEFKFKKPKSRKKHTHNRKINFHYKKPKNHPPFLFIHKNIVTKEMPILNEPKRRQNLELFFKSLPPLPFGEEVATTEHLFTKKLTILERCFFINYLEHIQKNQFNNKHNNYLSHEF